MAPPVEVLVVLVNYRSAALTLRALDSLASERARPELSIRAVVVENASGDEGALQAGIAERFSDFASLVVSPINGGFGAGNNLGVRTAMEAGSRARYIHLLNPDTEARPSALLSLVRFFESHPKAGIAGGSFEQADGSLWNMAFRFPSAASELEAACHLSIVSKLLKRRSVARTMGDQPEQVDWQSGASIMLRREVFETVGGFDEAFFLYFEETDLCVRAKAAGWECWYVPDSRVMHICGASTGVTAHHEQPRRLPRYWFESRRRFFVKHHGYAYAAFVDAATVLGHAIGTVKDFVKREPRVPHLVRDLVSESVLLPANRKPLEPARCYVLPTRG